MYNLPPQFSDLSPRRQREIAAYAQKVHDDSVDDAIRMLLSIPVLVLKDKFGFGKTRMHRFIQCVGTWIEAINHDANTMLEIYETAQKEAGFSLEMVGDKK